MLNPLDDVKLIESIDTGRMLDATSSFADQCAEAESIAAAADLKSYIDAAAGISSVVTLGMGGSGIGGDVAKAMFENEIFVPVTVNKGYDLPAFVGGDTVVVAVSYSGETEETLATFEAALAADARIVVITSGGTIGEKAARLGLPVVEVPAGLQPRAALGYLALPVLVVLRRMGLAPDGRGDIAEAITLLENLNKQYAADIPTDENPAKQLADELQGVVPVIYGSEGLPAVAALRWKCQLNENAKVPAFWHAFPELNHNEIVGWQELADITDRFQVVVLRDADENERVKARIEFTLPLIEGNLGGITQVRSEGKSRLARVMSLVYLGDFASVYLAILNGVDPTPVARIQELKRKLKEI